MERLVLMAVVEAEVEKEAALEVMVATAPQWVLALEQAVIAVRQEEEMVVRVEPVTQNSISFLLTLLMQECPEAKAVVAVVQEMPTAWVAPPVVAAAELLVLLPSNPVWVMVLVVLVRMVPPGVVRLEVQAATAATAEEQQDCV